MDDGIRERHGCYAVKENEKDGTEVILTERMTGLIAINSSYDERRLTPTQARYLARKLYRLARRIEARQA